MERTYKFFTLNRAKMIEATFLPIKMIIENPNQIEFEIKFDGHTYKASWTPDTTLKHKNLPFGYTLRCDKGICTKTDKGLSDWIADCIEQAKTVFAEREAARKKNYKKFSIAYYDEMIGGLNVDDVLVDMRNMEGEIKRLAKEYGQTEAAIKERIEKQIEKREKKAAESKEKYEAALKLAKETKKRQVLSSWMDEKEHVQYVMPDGTIKTETYES